MKVEDARKICDLLDPVRFSDGNLRCRHLLEQGLCRLPTKFRCDVVTYLERHRHEKSWSYSRLSYFIRCPRSYKFRYIDMVESKPMPYYWLGNQFHKAIARIVSGMEWRLDEPPEYVEPHEVLKLKALLDVASKRELIDTSGRHEVSFDIQLGDNCHFIGFADFLSYDGRLLRELKYAQDDSSYHLVTVYYQVGLYLLAFPSVEEVEIVVYKKSAIRPGKSESLEDFYQRAVSYYEGSDIKVMRKYLRNEFDLERIKKELLWLVRLVDESTKSDIWPMAAYGVICNSCEYYEHCRAELGSEPNSH